MLRSHLDHGGGGCDDWGMTTGVLLAAGAGRRMGVPKALVHDDDGTSWLRRAVGVLSEGGCARIVVVLGADAATARTLLDGLDVDVVVAAGWAEGMGASLRAGLEALEALEALAGDDPDDDAADTALVSLVDLPDVTPAVVRRVLAAAGGPAALARATYDGRPGHPVLLGREHWRPMAAGLSGDEGGRAHLETHGALAIECGDLATGRDVDTRPAAPAPTSGQRPRT